MREVILDTETTGLSHIMGDRIIEVACVELINHVASGKTLQFYCSTDKKISEEAVAIHGLTNDFLKDHGSFEDRHKKFLEFIKNDVLIIHNAEFDLGFINNELKIIGKKPIKNEFIDTVQLARKVLKTRIANLDYLCRRFSIDLSKRSYHGALLDCQLLAEVYLELVGGKQTRLELKDLKKTEKTAKDNKTAKKNEIKKIQINQEIIESHKKFVKNIKNSLWTKLDY
tara:strand:- start:411 stop:1091 length:681 start_codon:yes stop_codon:yes gene_type:complete